MYQYVNGIVLILVFFCVRLLYGTYMVSQPMFRTEGILICILQSFYFYCTLYEVRDRLSVPFLIVLVVGNAVLNFLNIFWFVDTSSSRFLAADIIAYRFSKMIVTIRKRFEVDKTPNLTDAKPKKQQ